MQCAFNLAIRLHPEQKKEALEPLFTDKNFLKIEAEMKLLDLSFLASPDLKDVIGSP